MPLGIGKWLSSVEWNNSNEQIIFALISDDRRQPMKSKLSPPNSNSNGQLNPPTFSKGLDEWLNNNNYRESINYQQKNMDDWLNATMKDSPKTFSVASGDFLDGPSAMNGISAPIIETNHGVPDSTVNSF